MDFNKRLMRRSRPISAIVLIGLMSITLYVGFTQHVGSFDDAYITYRYARNIVLGNGFVYNSTEAVLGTTTPLYTLLLAGSVHFSPDIVLNSHVFSVLAWAMCVMVIYGLARNHGSELTAFLAAALIATNALFLNVLGMETAVYILLALTTFFLQSRNRSSWAAVSAGWC
jgi:arabinofuranosyltransferase